MDIEKIERTVEDLRTLAESEQDAYLLYTTSALAEILKACNNADAGHVGLHGELGTVHLRKIIEKNLQLD